MLITLVLIFALLSPTVLSVPNNIEQLLNELNGGHLRFSAAPVQSLLNIRKSPNGTFIYEGVHAEAVQFMARLLNITYSFVNVNDSEIDSVGPLEASINILLRKEVDVCTFGMMSNLDHCSRMDCSFPFTTLVLGMMVPLPEESSRILAIIQPFQSNVWLMILISTVALVFALVGIPGIYFKYFGGEIRHSSLEITPTSFSSSIWTLTHLGNAALYVTTIFTSQGNVVRFKQLSFRIVAATLCLSAFVLVNAYSSTLISYLTASKLPVTKTLEELAAGSPQNLKITTRKNSVISDVVFANPHSDHMKVLGDSLRKNPETLFTNQIKAFKMLYSGSYAYVEVAQLLYPILNAANKKAGFCKFTISNDRVLSDFVVYSVYTFPKHWRYSDAVNFKLQAWLEAGLVDHWLKMYVFPKNDKCSLNNYKDATAKIRKLSKFDLFGCFILLLLGCSLAFLVFLLERIVALAKKIRSQA